MRSFTVIPMNETHLEKIAQLEKQCFSQPWSVDALREELTNENSHFLVAADKDETLGYIGVQEICGEAYITNVAVFPDCRRLGVGRALLSDACDGAEGRGCDFITLEVRQSNAGAIALYESEGFETVGVRKDFYSFPTENGLILTKYFKQEV